MNRCRLCATNDREEFVEQLPSEMWHSRLDSEIDPPWERVSGYRRDVMTHFACTTLAMLERDHA